MTISPSILLIGAKLPPLADGKQLVSDRKECPVSLIAERTQVHLA